MSITQLSKSGKDNYGTLNINFGKAIKSAYPKLAIGCLTPGAWGHVSEASVEDDILWVGQGKYISAKHRHTCGTGIVEIETARNNKLNLGKKPLFLLRTYLYNGDYRKVTERFYLFGQNEDNSYFVHKIRPKAGKEGLDAARAWMWSVKEGEQVKARQGDLGFISVSKEPARQLTEAGEISLGNHTVSYQKSRQTKNKVLVFNPAARHGEHDQVTLEGWFDLRLAKAWQSSTAD